MSELSSLNFSQLSKTKLTSMMKVSRFWYLKDTQKGKSHGVQVKLLFWETSLWLYTLPAGLRQRKKEEEWRGLTGCSQASHVWWRSPWVSWWPSCSRGLISGWQVWGKARHPDAAPAQPGGPCGKNTHLHSRSHSNRGFCLFTATQSAAGFQGFFSSFKQGIKMILKRWIRAVWIIAINLQINRNLLQLVPSIQPKLNISEESRK